jgi:hypothetical protein
MPDELLRRYAQVHALDAYADLEASLRIAVEADSVEPLVAVYVVVEPSPRAGLGQPHRSDLFEPDGPHVR